MRSIQSYLYLIGCFLKGIQGLSKREGSNPYEKLFEEVW
jgi:hypothetical protein